MQLMSISRDGENLWRAEYLREDGHRVYSYYHRKNYPDELAVYKQFLWENSDAYPYRHYRA